MKKLAELKQVANILDFVADFCKKEDVEIQDKIDHMQENFDLEYAELERKMKKLLSLEIEKEKSGNICNEVLKEKILKFKAIDFVMKFYELVSITKIGFREYVEKDLSRDMFTDSIDLSIVAEFRDWLCLLEKPSKSENSLELPENKDTSSEQRLKPNKSENKSPEGSSSNPPETVEIRRKLIAQENIFIDRKTLLNPKFSQVDVLMQVKEKKPEELEMDIREPLIISLLFECAFCGEEKGGNEVKESLIMRSKILNSRSSKKANFRSHKALLKGSRSLSSGKKPSPFKFQTEITGFFEKKSFKWSAKQKILDQVSLDSNKKAQIVKKKQLFNSLLTQMAQKPQKPKVLIISEKEALVHIENAGQTLPQVPQKNSNSTCDRPRVLQKYPVQSLRHQIQTCPIGHESPSRPTFLWSSAQN